MSTNSGRTLNTSTKLLLILPARGADMTNILPKLIPAGNNPLIAATKNIRTLLKHRFPTVDFRITSKRYSGGNSIRVQWINGPTSGMVDEITSMFEAGSFDGMTDCYNYSQENRDFGSTKYLFLDRELTEDARNLPLEHFNITKDMLENMDWREKHSWEAHFSHFLRDLDLTAFDQLAKFECA